MQELQLAICLYPKRSLSRPRDLIRMSEVPVLVIEILSPQQLIADILEKFEIYFALGVRSCWLVEPATEVVTVYSSLSDHQAVSVDEVIDDQLGIRLDIKDIFDKN